MDKKCLRLIGFSLLLLEVSLREAEGDQRCLSDENDVYCVDPCRSHFRETYDFIIVGGGTAGSVLASRLSEVADWSVLLLEAGEDETYQSKIPFFAQHLAKTRFDWNYTTTWQPNVCQSSGGYCRFQRGRALGGSSAVNYMVHMRGLRQDFDRWEAEGNAGWSADQVFPYFQKAEKFVHIKKKSRSIGRGGPLPVSENEPTWLTAYMTSALKELRLSEADLNEGTGSGFMPLQVNVDGGERVSANSAFLRPARYRRNLHVLTSSFVTKVLFANRTAVGVEFEHETGRRRVSALREVILSAGSVNSPQILMLSGVGPADHLRHLGLPVVQDLPVGLSLQDHVGFFAFFKMKHVPRASGEEILGSMTDYLYNQTGLLSYPLGGLLVVLRNSSLSTSENPDMQLHLGRSDDQDECYLNGFISRPESRGSVSLRSNSPHDPPLIDPNCLSSAADVAVMKELVEFVFQLASTSSLRSLGITYLSHLHPACENRSDFVDCVVRNYAQPFHHPVATCKMGPETDPYAVVDASLRVYGVQRLRVVDASVMPHVPTSNINAPTLMVAEKAADLIKLQHSTPQETCCS